MNFWKLMPCAQDEDRIDNLLREAYQYGTINKVIVCASEDRERIQRMLAVACPPIATPVYTFKGISKGQVYVIERELADAMVAA